MIRPIMPRDVFKVAELAEMMHAEGRYKDFKFDKKRFVNGLLNMLKNMTLVGFVDEKNERVIGVVIGYVDEYLFCKENILHDYGMYVLPQYRKTKSAAKLLKSFIQAGKDIGVKEVCAANTNMTDPDALDSLYKKVGFEKVGSVYKVRF